MYRRSRTQGESLGRFVRIAGALACCLAGLLLLTADLHAPPRYARAQAPESKPAGGDHAIGRLIRIPLPITGLADMQVKRAVRKALSEMPARQSARHAGLRVRLEREPNGPAAAISAVRSTWPAFCPAARPAPLKPWPTFPGRSRATPCWWPWLAKKSSWRPTPRSARPASISRPKNRSMPPMRSGYQEIANRRGTIPG